MMTWVTPCVCLLQQYGSGGFECGAGGGGGREGGKFTDGSDNSTGLLSSAAGPEGMMHLKPLAYGWLRQSVNPCHDGLPASRI